ncbi:MAG: hypothetical protein ACLP07_13130 [Terracidiphilus sp.]
MIRSIGFLAALYFAALVCGQGQAVPGRDSVPDAGLRRFEIGGQAADLHFSSYDPEGPSSQPGFGVGAAVNLKPALAFESRLNLTPFVNCHFSAVCGGHAAEFLVGARGEARSRRWGLFGEAEPGFVSWSEATTSVTLSSQTYNPIRQRRTFFAMELGGGLEYLPAPRVHLRADLSDLLIKYDGSQLYTENGPTYLSCFECKRWIDNLHATAGVYWSLGKPLS